MRTTLIALILSLATPMMAAPRHHSADTATAEVDSAKAALKLAKLKAKAHKAAAKAQKLMQRVRTVVLDCEQAVSDLCVETAKPDGSTDCEAPSLFTQCHGPVGVE